MKALQFIITFVNQHTAMVALFGIAGIKHMQERLPYPFNKLDIFNWTWTWLRDSLQEAVSNRK